VFAESHVFALCNCADVHGQPRHHPNCHLLPPPVCPGKPTTRVPCVRRTASVVNRCRSRGVGFSQHSHAARTHVAAASPATPASGTACHWHPPAHPRPRQRPPGPAQAIMCHSRPRPWAPTSVTAATSTRRHLPVPTLRHAPAAAPAAAHSHWHCATGHWQLATGHWPLATGNWQLATGTGTATVTGTGSHSRSRSHSGAPARAGARSGSGSGSCFGRGPRLWPSLRPWPWHWH